MQHNSYIDEAAKTPNTSKRRPLTLTLLHFLVRSSSGYSHCTSQVLPLEFVIGSGREASQYSITNYTIKLVAVVARQDALS